MHLFMYIANKYNLMEIFTILKTKLMQSGPSTRQQTLKTTLTVYKNDKKEILYRHVGQLKTVPRTTLVYYLDRQKGLFSPFGLPR